MQATLLGRLHARIPARFGFAVTGLRRARRTALCDRREHVDFELLLAARDAQAVASVQQFGRFARAIVDADLAAFDGLLGERARLEEPRRPQPYVKAYAGSRRCIAQQAFQGVFTRTCCNRSSGKWRSRP